MKLQYDAMSIANMEDELNIRFLDLFNGQVRVEETIKSVKTMLALISAGYGNDKVKANEVYMEELKSGKTVANIFEEILNSLQEAGFLPRVEEKPDQRLLHGEELSKANGNEEKKQQ